MKLWIDADGCPVVDLAVRLAGQYYVPCTILCDTSHRLEKPGAETITVSKGADSVDFALVNRVTAGDLVVTQDYGLAAMCLSKKAVPIHQDGMVYTDENIEGLLFFRAAAKKIRNSGGRLRGPKKRTADQDRTFAAALESLLREGNAMSWTVYMLRCRDGSLYTGITDDLDRRIQAHNAGKGAKYTKGRGPVTVVYTEEVPDKSAALKREYAIKHLKKAEKEVLL